MRRILIAFGAIGLATVFLLGPGRSLLPGSLRLQAPAGALVAPAPDAVATTHDGHAASSASATRPAIVPPPDGARVDVSTRRATPAEQGYVVETKVVSRDGKPVNDAVVRFYEQVDFFGPREELIGSARTDGQGAAAITYLPSSTGPHDIVVRFAGQESLVPSVGTASFEASVAAPPYHTDQPALLAFTRLVPYAAGAIVLAVWGLIAFALFGTARGIAVSADQTYAKEDTA
jgi:hypothetical protein